MPNPAVLSAAMLPLGMQYGNPVDTMHFVQGRAIPNRRCKISMLWN